MAVVTTAGGGATGAQWVEGMAAAKHPAVHRMAPQQSDLAPGASHRELRKPVLWDINSIVIGRFIFWAL